MSNTQGVPVASGDVGTVSLELTSEDADRIAKAARASSEHEDDFVRRAALERAQAVLANLQITVVSPKEFQQLQVWLDADDDEIIPELLAAREHVGR